MGDLFTDSQMTGSTMQPKRTVARVSSGVLLATSLLLMVLYHLPWLELTRDHGGLAMTSVPAEVGTATGLQLAAGTMTAKPEASRLLPSLVDSGMYDDEIKPRPTFYIGLIAPVFLLIIAVLGLKACFRGVLVGILTLILAIPGSILLLLATDVEYTEDFIADLRRREPAHEPWVTGSLPPVQRREKEKRITDEYKTWTSAHLWSSLVLYCLASLLGILNVICPVAKPVAQPCRRSAAPLQSTSPASRRDD